MLFVCSFLLYQFWINIEIYTCNDQVIHILDNHYLVGLVNEKVFFNEVDTVNGR